MGGKGGGGGGGYYQQPADTSGWGTPEEADATLAKQAPVDLSALQANINAKRAAAEATAPDPIKPVVPQEDVQLSEKLASTVLDAPKYWTKQNEEAALAPRRVAPKVDTSGTQI